MLVYFAIAITLCAFGFVAIFSVGAPFLLTGAAMLVASPWRGRRDVLWPVVAAPWAFTVTYILLAPLGLAGGPAMGAQLDLRLLAGHGWNGNLVGVAKVTTDSNGDAITTMRR